MDKAANEIGYRMHAMHETAPKATQAAKEILASLMDPGFRIEADMVREGLHFMLPASWALEAIQVALESDPAAKPDRA